MLKLEIVTPERRVLDAEVESVTIPTASGEAGILPHHAPLISAVKPGVLSYSTKGANEKVVLSAGFVEVNADTVSVLVDTAETPGEIDADAARSSRESAEKALVSAGTVPVEEAEAAREQIDHANARVLTAAGR
jgi:F-type H+-transporting ATPase subunit epsilon